MNTLIYITEYCYPNWVSIQLYNIETQRTTLLYMPGLGHTFHHILMYVCPESYGPDLMYVCPGSYGPDLF